MAIVQISKIQIRTGKEEDLPILSPGELGYTIDTKRLFIGNENSVIPLDNTEIITANAPISAPGGEEGNGQVIFNQYGTFTGDQNLLYNPLIPKLSIIGDLEVTGTIKGNIDISSSGISGILPIELGGTGRDLSNNNTTGYFYFNSDDKTFYINQTIDGEVISGDIVGNAGNVTGVVAIANGGTGSDNQQDAINALSGILGSSGPNLVLRSDGINVSLSKLNLSTDITDILSIAHGGTGADNQQSALNNLAGLDGNINSALADKVLKSDSNGQNIVLEKLNLATDLDGILPILNGGTGQSSFTAGYIKSDGTTLSSSATVSGSDVDGDITGNSSNVTGIIAIENGGTGADNVNDAINNLLPDQTNNDGKVLRTNAGSIEWHELILMSGTVTSVDVSGGTTGLTFTGGPITESGIITLDGTLSIANGGTGQTSFTAGYIKSDGTTLSSTEKISGSDIEGNISGAAAQVNTVKSDTSDVVNYLTFVDSNNNESTPETVYTNDNISFNIGTNEFKVQGDITSLGTFNVAHGADKGIQFTENPYGGTGDTAKITLESATGGESIRMRFTITNEEDDYFEFSAPSNNGLKMNGFTVWHQGNQGINSGLDADTLRGMLPEPMPAEDTVSTIVTRDFEGTITSITSSTEKILLGPKNESNIQPSLMTSNVFQTTFESMVTVDIFSTFDFKSAKYFIQVSQGSNAQVSEVLLVHNETNVNVIEYGVIHTSNKLYDIQSSLFDSYVTLNIVLLSNAPSTIIVNKTMNRNL